MGAAGQLAKFRRLWPNIESPRNRAGILRALCPEPL